MSLERPTPNDSPQEIQPGGYSISDLPTDITAFVGELTRGPRTKAVEINSFGDFERQYGRGSVMHTAIYLYFENGGKRAVVVRQRDESLKAFFQSLHALNEIENINQLCIPTIKPLDPDKIIKAVNYCEERRAFLILDASPVWFDIKDAVTGLQMLGIKSSNAALYFPRLMGRGSTSIPACGAIAGVFARTDELFGCWKSPAGREADLSSVRGPAFPVNTAAIETLQQASINTIRTDENIGAILWGARTLAGNDNEWRYIAVRRTALFIENSIYNGTKWAAEEPNTAQLWQDLTQTVEAFMATLYQRGAFQGETAGDSFYVRCDSTTTTPQDIRAGKVNLLIGFAPLKPAEFVTFKITLQVAAP